MTNDNLTELEQLLERASPEDRANLQRIIGAGFGDSPRLLCDHIHFLRSGTFGQLFDRGDYKQLVTDVADHVRIDWNTLLRGRVWHDLAPSEIEDVIVVTAFQQTFAKLSEDDRRRLAEQLCQQANDPQLIRQLLSGGALVAANLSGFQIYLMATTAVAALSGTLGVVLPFGIYTAMTTGIGIVIGPIGWALLGLSVLFKLNSANWTRLVPGIIYVSYIRHKLACENDRNA